MYNTKIDVRTIKQAAQGRWFEILSSLGVAKSHLTGLHTSCPICGGKDRFRFDDKYGNGSYFCNGCGSGDGITLLRKLHNWKFNQVLSEISRSLIGTLALCPPPPTVNRQEKQDESKLWRSKYYAKILRQAGPITRDCLAAKHYEDRAIPFESISDVLRFDPQCAYYASKNKVLSYMPAILAPVSGADGRLMSLQVIYLNPDGTTYQRKVKPAAISRGTMGGAIRLNEPAEIMVVGEGIETVLSASILLNLPALAALSVNGLKGIKLPPVVKSVV